MIVKEAPPVFHQRMNFRRWLLFFSITMIAFCLTLYFQSVETVKSVNFDPTMNVMVDMEKSHSLAELDQKLGTNSIEQFIQVVYEKNKLAGEKTRVMEIGSGNGRVIMELKKLFPDVEFYGVVKEKTHDFFRRESFAVTAVNFGIFGKSDLEGLELPYAVFEDLDFGNPIPYADNRFDLIYSQNTLRHFKYKFELFNEIFRVLKQGGISIHTDLPPINIYDNGVVLSLSESIIEFRRRGMNVQLIDGDGILFRKTRATESFPVTPHQPIPASTENLPQELRRPEMGYNLL